MEMYTFKPILKEIIWGGTDIRPFKGLPPGDGKIGESWELSQVEGNDSIVDGGTMDGKTIGELIGSRGAGLLGKKVMRQYGGAFPLLIKFIDARDDLSIQVHPGDELAWRRHRSAGKTEMWYVVKAAPGAALYSGFSRQIDADEYVRLAEENRIVDVLRRYEVKAGDVFFLPAGRVHAIGAGCFVAEIQQSSNITYRICDYGRRDAAGNLRELHTALARDAIDYSLLPDYRTCYTPRRNTVVPLVRCDYFSTSLLDMDAPLRRDLSAVDSFVVYVCTEGRAVLRDDRNGEFVIRQGQTVLVSAAVSVLAIFPEPQAKLLETYV
jgi:mannose-6-phosphate isomerase